MKFNLLNENKLQIIISQSDLKSRNMKKWDLVPYNPNAQDLFQEILERANEDCGFEVMRDTQLMVEAYPISGESMIMTITKITEKEVSIPSLFGGERDSQEEREFFQTFKELLSRGSSVVYEFDELEDVIEAAHWVSEKYPADSALYRRTHDGKYFVYFHDIDALAEDALGHLIEHGSRTHYTDAYLLEHTECVIPEKALKHLSTV